MIKLPIEIFKNAATVVIPYFPYIYLNIDIKCDLFIYLIKEDFKIT